MKTEYSYKFLRMVLRDGSHLTNGKEEERGYKMRILLRDYDVVQDRILWKECTLNLFW